MRDSSDKEGVAGGESRCVCSAQVGRGRGRGREGQEGCVLQVLCPMCQMERESCKAVRLQFKVYAKMSV